MTLVWIILLPLLGGFAAWLSYRWGDLWPRWVSLATLTAHMALLVVLWVGHLDEMGRVGGGPWLMQFDAPWIPSWGASFQLGLDGLSLLLLLLANFLAIVAVAASWNVIQKGVGFFHFNLLWVLAAFAGVFLALDLFLFYVFWEILLVPLYFLIGIWGHENRTYATIKFFIFTQASGLFMLLGIIGLYFVHGRATGTYTFDYFQLLGTPMSYATAFWLMLGFFIAFAVKLPAFLVHTWLPDAHTEAPTAGSVDLAGLVLKIGGYGMLRFVVPLFPQAAFDLAPAAMALAVAGILYGAVVAFGQTDVKRLVAYTSISHMGFVMLGVFAWNEIALQGALIVMLAHGISTGALFILVGDIDYRIDSRNLDRMGGLWSTIPRLGGVGLFFAVASLGLPGLGNFVGEFLVLVGTYQVNVPAAGLAALGLVVASVYSLWMMHRVFYGENTRQWKLPDISGREAAIFASMMAISVWLGMYPQPFLRTSRPAMQELQILAGREEPQTALARKTEPQPAGARLARAEGSAHDGR